MIEDQEFTFDLVSERVSCEMTLSNRLFDLSGRGVLVTGALGRLGHVWVETALSSGAWVGVGPGWCSRAPHLRRFGQKIQISVILERGTLLEGICNVHENDREQIPHFRGG